MMVGRDGRMLIPPLRAVLRLYRQATNLKTDAARSGVRALPIPSIHPSLLLRISFVDISTVYV
jgi:hypothetical protein